MWCNDVDFSKKYQHQKYKGERLWGFYIQAHARAHTHTHTRTHLHTHTHTQNTHALTHNTHTHTHKTYTHTHKTHTQHNTQHITHTTQHTQHIQHNTHTTHMCVRAHTHTHAHARMHTHTHTHTRYNKLNAFVCLGVYGWFHNDKTGNHTAGWYISVSVKTECFIVFVLVYFRGSVCERTAESRPWDSSGSWQWVASTRNRSASSFSFPTTLLSIFICSRCSKFQCCNGCSSSSWTAVCSNNITRHPIHPAWHPCNLLFTCWQVYSLTQEDDGMGPRKHIEEL